MEKIMEKIKNPRSMDSQPIWLKWVRSKPDWLDMTNPWLKEVIWMNKCIVGQVRLVVFSISHSIDVWRSRLYMFHKFICM